MKRALAFASAVLFAGLSASLALADAPSSLGPPSTPSTSSRSTLLNDLVRMTRAGDSDAALLAYARARRAELPPELNLATLQWLRDSGVRPAVVSYMSAIDVRAQSADVSAGGRFSEGVTYADQAGRPRPTEGGDDTDYDAGDVGSGAGSEIYTGLGSNAGGAPYSDSYDDPYSGYGYGPYSSFGYGYPYWGSPFPTWFVVDISHDHSHGHHGWRDHDHHGGGGHDGGGWHHGGGGRHDGWRDRGSHGSRDGGMTARRTSPRAAIAGSARSTGGARGGRGGPAWGGGRNPGEVGPRGRPAATRGFTRPAPGFHGPAPGRSGGSIARAPIAAPARGGGGVRTAGPASGSAGGRGRR
jgi:hypothetical protein